MLTNRECQVLQVLTRCQDFLKLIVCQIKLLVPGINSNVEIIPDLEKIINTIKSTTDQERFKQFLIGSSINFRETPSTVISDHDKGSDKGGEERTIFIICDAVNNGVCSFKFDNNGSIID